MMPSLTWSSKNRDCSCHASHQTDHEGLKLILKNLTNANSNVVVKPISLMNSSTPTCYDHHQFCCYLKSCHLCHKPLGLDEEIYMYRGDLGFCSVECRERQIYMDEMKEMEICKQQRLASLRRQRRHDGGGGRCEIGGNLEEFRRRKVELFSHSSS